MNPENYIIIMGWMVTELGLKGAELLIYALIYGFSQDGENEFQGSISYICEWVSASKPTVIKALSNLTDRGLILKHEIEVANNIKVVHYKISLLAVKKFNWGGKEILLGGGKETLPNNTNINNTNKNTNRDIESICERYNRICVSYPSIKQLSDTRKKAIKARLNTGYTVDDFEKMFKIAEESDFLKGKNDRNWSATFDWMIKDGNMAKILDGNYKNKGTPIKKNAFHNFQQRDYNFNELESMFVNN